MSRPFRLRARLAALACLTLLAAPPASAQLGELLKQLPLPGSGETAAGALSGEEIAKGLKEALSVGSKKAIERLGKKGGYLARKAVRIELPESLAPLETALDAVGQSQVSEDFVVSMNRAAERAVPEAAEVISESISSMTLDDARAILEGPDDAATQYFKRTGESGLRERMAPIVREATSDVGVTAAYKDLVDGAGFAANFVDLEALDLDAYVTRRAVDGLFVMLAREEKRIRENPAARTTDLLRKVFGE